METSLTETPSTFASADRTALTQAVPQIIPSTFRLTVWAVPATCWDTGVPAPVAGVEVCSSLLQATANPAAAVSESTDNFWSGFFIFSSTETTRCRDLFQMNRDFLQFNRSHSSLIIGWAHIASTEDRHHSLPGESRSILQQGGNAERR